MLVVILESAYVASQRGSMMMEGRFSAFIHSYTIANYKPVVSESDGVGEKGNKYRGMMNLVFLWAWSVGYTNVVGYAMLVCLVKAPSDMNGYQTVGNFQVCVTDEEAEYYHAGETKRERDERHQRTPSQSV